jgi:hypothetical protein
MMSVRNEVIARAYEVGHHCRTQPACSFAAGMKAVEGACNRQSWCYSPGDGSIAPLPIETTTATRGCIAVLAIVQSDASQKDAARKSAEKARDVWNGVKNPGLLTTFRVSIAKNEKLLAQLP